MYWQSDSLHWTKSLPLAPSDLRRRRAMDTVSEMTVQRNDLEGVRLTDLPPGSRGCKRRRERVTGPPRPASLFHEEAFSIQDPPVRHATHSRLPRTRMSMLAAVATVKVQPGMEMGKRF